MSKYIDLIKPIKLSPKEVEKYAISVGAATSELLGWHVKDLGFDLLQQSEYSSKDITVGVADTGMDVSHNDLPQIQTYFNTTTEQTKDHNGHGTHVIGIISATWNNDIGTVGVTDSAIIPAQCMLAEGTGLIDNIAEAITVLVDIGCDIINASIGSTQLPPKIQAAIQYGFSKGTIFVCAAGNRGSNKIDFPAAIDHPLLISVAAHGKKGELADFSNYSKGVTVAAPGIAIYSTLPNNKYEAWAGTSMATPVISGGIALMLQYGAKPNEVKSLLHKYVLRYIFSPAKEIPVPDFPAIIEYLENRNIESTDLDKQQLCKKVATYFRNIFSRLGIKSNS